MLINIKELIQKFNININGILHIGAHNCEELTDYTLNNINTANIYWIEALPELVEKNKKNNPYLNIYQAVIYDEDDKEIEFNITNCDGDKNNLQSSSILEFGSHEKHHPQVKIVNKIKLKTSRMDTVIEKNNINMDNINFINLDIQGVELRALKSMEKYLKNVDYIYSEVNTEEVYKNCDKMEDLTEYLSNFGFKLADARIYTQFGWGDGFYIREKINYYYSQDKEDIYLNTNYFKNKTNGVYIELGALDGKLYSNTKFFEDHLHWSGILIEPHPEKFKLLKNNRPKNYLFNNLVSNGNDELEFKYFVDHHAAVSGVKNTLPDSHYNNYFNKFLNLSQNTIFIKPISLTEIIKKTPITHIDLLSLDVEGHEYEVLLSYDFSVKIDVILIELLGDNKERDELCRNLLIKNNYKFDMRLGRNEIFLLNDK